MHNSPFEKFRENQKIWMAGLAIVAMVSFVVLPALTKNADPSSRVGSDKTSDVVLTSKFGPITEAQLQREMINRRMAGQFLALVVDSKYEKLLGDSDITDSRVRQQAVMKRYGYQQFNIPPESARLRGFIGGFSEDETVRAMLIEKQAEELGIPVSEKMITDFMTNLRTEYKMPETDDPNAKEIPICQVTSDELEKLISTAERSFRGFRYETVLEQIRNALLRSRYEGTGIQQAALDPPLKRWNNYNRATRRAGVEVIPVSVESYVNKVPDPTAKEIEDFFNARKDKLQSQVETPDEFGFRLPTRVSLQYYFINEDKLIASYKPSVTDKEIEEYYEKNKAQFPAAKLPDLNKEEKKPEKRKSDEPKKDDTKASESEPAKTEPGKSDDGKTDANAPAAEPAKSDAPKSEPAKSDAPKTDAGKSEPAKTDETKINDKGSSREKSLRVIPAAYQTKTDDKADASKTDASKTNAVKADADKSKADAAKEADKAKPDASKTEPTTTDAAKTESPQADASGSDALKADPGKPDPIAPGSKDGKVDYSLDPSKLTLPTTQYEPLEKVRDRIVMNIARERANKRRDEVLDKLRAKMVEYVTKYEDEIYELEHNKDRKAKLPPFNMEISKEIDATIQYGELKLVSLKELNELDVGKSTVFVEEFRQSVPLAQYALMPKNGMRWFKPLRSTSVTMNYLVWKTDQIGEEEPKLDDPLTRDKVIHAWKFVKARELAKAEAQRLADKAKEAKKKFSDLHKESPEFPEPRVEPGFSWMILRGQNQGMPELSSPTSVENAGTEFMETVFGLPEGGTGIAFNTTKDKVYAIYVTYMDKVDKYQTSYLQDVRTDAGYEPYAGVNLEEMRDRSRAFVESFNRRFDIKYNRQLKTAQDQEIEE